MVAGFNVRRSAAPARTGRGVNSFAPMRKKALAKTNFCACKLKQGGLPPGWNRYGRSQTAAHHSQAN